jgi:hypothetical protein
MQTYDVWAGSDFVMLLVPYDNVRKEYTKSKEGELDACKLSSGGRISSVRLSDEANLRDTRSIALVDLSYLPYKR